MSRRSDIVEHSSEARQYMFKGVGTGSFHTKDENDDLLRNSKMKVNNKLTESELAALDDQPLGNNNPKGKSAVFSRLFKRTKKWTSLPAQEVKY